MVFLAAQRDVAHRHPHWGVSVRGSVGLAGSRQSHSLVRQLCPSPQRRRCCDRVTRNVHSSRPLPAVAGAAVCFWGHGLGRAHLHLSDPGNLFSAAAQPYGTLSFVHARCSHLWLFRRARVGVFAGAGSATSTDGGAAPAQRSEEHTSELQSLAYLVCRLLLEKKKKQKTTSRCSGEP